VRRDLRPDLDDGRRRTVLVRPITGGAGPDPGDRRPGRWSRRTVRSRAALFQLRRQQGGLDPVEIDGTTVGIAVSSNGNGEAAWELPDGSHAYLRARRLERATLEAIIGRLIPRSPDAAIPGFDYRPDPAAPSLQLVAERLNTGISGAAARIECTVPATGYSYAISALDGDAVFEYGGVIDRPVPLHVGRAGTAVIIVSGPPDPTAPTPADVGTAGADEWHDALDAPTFNERAAEQAPPAGDQPGTTTPRRRR
jgi:hypothetical protein